MTEKRGEKKRRELESELQAKEQLRKIERTFKASPVPNFLKVSIKIREETDQIEKKGKNFGE